MANLHQLIGDDLSKVTIPFVVLLADIGYLRSILLGLQAFGCAHLLSFAALVHSCDPGYLKIYLKDLFNTSDFNSLNNSRTNLDYVFKLPSLCLLVLLDHILVYSSPAS